MNSRISVFRLAPFVLLVCALVGLVFWAGDRKANTYGPTLMARGSDGIVWIEINKLLFLTTADGETLQQLDPVELGIRGPLTAFAPLDDGSMLVGSRSTGVVHAVSPSGMARKRLDLDKLAIGPVFDSYKLAIDNDHDRMLVTDTSGHRLILMDRAGRTHASRSEAVLSLRYPNDVLYLPDGHAALVDTNHHRILLVDEELRPVGSIRVCDPCGTYRWPAMMARLADGSLMVSVLDNRMEGGELRRFTQEGKSLKAPALPEGAEPTSLLALGDHVLVGDQGSYRIHQFDGAGNALSDFGDFTIRAALAQAQEDEVFYHHLVLAAQLGLLVVLALLVWLYARGSLSLQKQLEAAAGPQVPPPGIGPRLLFGFLMLLAASFPAALISDLLVVITRFSRMVAADTHTWALFAGLPFLFLLPSLAGAHSLRRHADHGSFAPLWAWLAGRLYVRYKPMLDMGLAAGEKVEWYALARHTRGLRLVALSATRLLVLTLTQDGRSVMDFSYLPRVSLSKVGKGLLKRNLLLRMLRPLPLYRVSFRAGQSDHTLDFLDRPTATQLADLLRASARGIGPQDAQPIVLPTGPFACRNTQPLVALVMSLLIPGSGQLIQQRLLPGLLYLLAWGASLIALIPPLASVLRQTRDVPTEVLLTGVAAAALVWVLAQFDTVLLGPKLSDAPSVY